MAGSAQLGAAQLGDAQLGAVVTTPSGLVALPDTIQNPSTVGGGDGDGRHHPPAAVASVVPTTIAAGSTVGTPTADAPLPLIAIPTTIASGSTVGEPTAAIVAPPIVASPTGPIAPGYLPFAGSGARAGAGGVHNRDLAGGVRSALAGSGGGGEPPLRRQLYLYPTNNTLIYETPLDLAAITVVFTGGGAVLTDGLGVAIMCPFRFYIRAWSLYVTDPEEGGSCTVEVTKSTHADYPAGASITGSAPIVLASAAKARTDALSGWTKVIKPGEVLLFRVQDVEDIEGMTVQLWGSRVTLVTPGLAEGIDY